MDVEDLTNNQLRFVRAAESHGYTVDYGYSERCTEETKCPAVRIERDELAKFSLDVGAHFSFDNAGEELMVFANF